jgi:type II secretory pathway predicted ATPase ExeA
MYLEHFGLSEAPFTITPHTEFFFAGANRGATLKALVYAIAHGEGIVKVSGEVGSGKTMLCRVLVERLPKKVEIIYLAIPSLTRDEMLAAICTDLGVQTTDLGPNAILRELQRHLVQLHSEGKRAVALIDEAHAMPVESLEEIRLLSNLETNRSKLLQIALFGQPELDHKLALPQMRQLRERITHSFSLSPLTFEDVQAYLRFRLRAAGYRGVDVFSPACVKLIAKASEGLSRRVNIIADKSLLAAFAANTHSVTPGHVRAAIRDCDFARPSTRRSKTPWLVGGALVAGVLLGGLGMSFNSHETNLSARSEQPVAAPPAEPVSAPADAPQAPAPTAESTIAVPPAPPADPQPEADDLLASRLAATKQWLAQLAQSHFVIQLMVAGASEKTHIERYIRESEQSFGTERIYAYPLSINGIAKIGVLYGDYPNRDEAQRALAALPPSVAQFKPYLRSVQAIRGEAEFPGNF